MKKCIRKCHLLKSSVACKCIFRHTQIVNVPLTGQKILGGIGTHIFFFSVENYNFTHFERRNTFDPIFFYLLIFHRGGRG